MKEKKIHHDILIFIPTYNEHENVKNIYREIKNLNLFVDILFCDDNSPDGTGKVIDELMQLDEIINVIHRPKKLGLGTAHKESFKYAQCNGYNYVLTMDADFTHDPKYIPAMIAKKDEADVVIGSRWVEGASISGWGKIRLPFTNLWRNMIQLGLGMPYDCMGAFRLYNIKLLNLELLQTISSKGFSFNMETLYRLKEKNARIVEIPIHAKNREHGTSKLSGKIMGETAVQFLKLSFERLLKRKK